MTETERLQHRTVNELVNEALQHWGALTNAKPQGTRITFRTEDRQAFDQYTLTKHLEALNESRDLDPSGLTTLMMLRGLTEHHLRTVAFSAHELLMAPDSCKVELDAMRGLRDLVEDPDYVAIMDEFAEHLRKAADHYDMPEGRDNKGLNELLTDKYSLAYVRRDALKSIETLEAHQFTHGASDPNGFKYNRHVYEFWNVNSLLKVLLSQGVPGISLCLIRDPEVALASFFVFAIRNGETLMMVTDRDKTPHPAYHRMSRRPDRNLDNRAAKHWFPYQLLDLEKVGPEGREHVVAKDRTSLVRYNEDSVALKKIGELHPEQFVWLVLMFDLIRDRYWHENKRLPAASYTGEMIVKPHALIGANTSLVKQGMYKPLIAPPLTLKEVSLEATKKQWAHKSTRFNEWMEARYEGKVPEEALNPVGEQAAQKLLTSHPALVPLTLSVDRGHDRHGSLMALENMSPLAFGTQKELERDRVWVGRVNKMKVIQELAEREYDETHEEVERWYEEAVTKNAPMLIEAAARGELLVPNWKPGFGETGFKVGYVKRSNKNCVTQYVSTKVPKRSPYDWASVTFDAVNIYGGGQTRASRSWRRRREIPTGKYYCFLHTETVGTVWTVFRPTCPEALAVLSGVKVEDLPFGLQHWYPDEPYHGNSILNRVEPSDWVLKNPWMQFTPRVVLLLCKKAVYDKRKELGLPHVVLKETKEED